MSVRVQNLTKRFGGQAVVSDLSFEVGAGEVLGFLGPNGAGKSTTMKVITGYLRADDGTVSVSGSDPSTAPIEVHRKLGYLAESNPLYEDLFVREHLHCIAQMHRIPNRKERIAHVMDMTGLHREAAKKVKQLSKGYKQRLGLALALLHEPEVLILDEPTSGLDPNQLSEIRSLIRELGREKCIILSTHIMQEVQAVCDRVVIINTGKKVLDEPIGYLDNVAGTDRRIEVEFDRPVEAAQLLAIPGVSAARPLADQTVVLRTTRERDIRADVFQWAVTNKYAILEMRSDTKSVEDVFQLLTKTA